MKKADYNNNVLLAVGEMIETFDKGGLDAIYSRTNNQEQNPRYHSFNVGGHRERVEIAIQTIISYDKTAKSLKNYGWYHDIAKGFTTSYKDSGEPQELGHELAGYEFLNKFVKTNNWMLFCVKNHHKLSHVKFDSSLSDVGEYGNMTVFTDVSKLTNIMLDKVFNSPLILVGGFEKLLTYTASVFNNKVDTLHALKLLGYCLLADALGGFKEQIAFPQFFKAQTLIRFSEVISNSDTLFFEEDINTFSNKVHFYIDLFDSVDTPNNWTYDLDTVKKNSLDYLGSFNFKVGNYAPQLATSIMKREASKIAVKS